MNMPGPPGEEVPGPHVEKVHRLRLRLVWIVPIVAAVVGLTLMVHSWRERGPRVSITFESGEGLEVGKTLVKYRDVTIGRVTQITLSDDRTHVEVVADLVRSASDLAVEGAQFWVVRPRIGVGWASDLGTLLSGAYIGVEPGAGGGSRTHFVGLEVPPPLAHRTNGRRIVLQAHDLGSLSTGSPVYFHRFQVGRAIDVHLDDNSGEARVVVFIDAPHDKVITPATRFWNASGVDLDLNADGLKVRTQSVATVLAGGIAFADAPAGPDTNVAPPGAEFRLYRDEQTAMAPPDGEPHIIRMRFEKPLRGLAVGAPIEFVGVEIGMVTSIDVGYEPKTQHFPVFVTGKIFPRRMGLAYTTLHANGEPDTDDSLAELTDRLISHGLRVQPKSGNLLTGRLYLDLDFVPAAARATFNPAARPIELPTVESNMGELQAGIAHVVKKLEALPLDRVVNHLDQDLTDLHGTLGHVNDTLLPSATQTLGTMHEALENVDELLTTDSAFRSDLEQTLGDVQQTLRSFRALADYLDRHPEALIKGRAAERGLPEPASPAKREVEK
jgi:paraquat-inducible protein B